MHKNPVSGKWKLVENYLEYKYSSARFYELGEEPECTLYHYSKVYAAESPFQTGSNLQCDLYGRLVGNRKIFVSVVESIFNLPCPRRGTVLRINTQNKPYVCVILLVLQVDSFSFIIFRIISNIILP